MSRFPLPLENETKEIYRFFRRLVNRENNNRYVILNENNVNHEKNKNNGQKRR